ncbi:facilitated trehalose transporter Tret1-like [Spodoptera frugiperda]|uniref:Facilitated trehalose transporter Tret1-like n=1 Tax=Spodoptera frugiperda TaxID=7108 RepID=A0A9R0DTA5_SPOFR|nr:facilitated trehalose transporter Tret1-like [Spodoptera frugiperda]
MEKEKVRTKELLIQVLATAIICFQACLTGFVVSWPSYTVGNFMSNETVLSRPMSSLDVSLLGSLPNIGGLIVSPFCGYAFNTFGRKYATILFTVPYILTWLIISVTSSVPLVLASMCIGGIGIAGQNVAIIYISEIAHDSIRGGLTASSASGYFLGILITYALGGNLAYMEVLYTHLGLSILCVLLLLTLPESPVFLVLVGREEDAAKSISFYRQLDVKSKEVEAEIAKIRLQIDPRLETLLEGDNDPETLGELVEKKLGAPEERKKESAWKHFKKSKSSKRALMMVLIIMALTIMMGCVVLQVYAEPLFKEAAPSMPSNQCAIFLALDFLVASILCVLAIDRFGRKFLLILTAGGSGICTVLLGAQLQFHWAPAWFTVLLIYGFSFIFTLGCAVIPFVLTAEIFLPEVRSFCNSVVMAFTWIFNFLTLVIFHPLVEAIGLGPVFYFFSVVCFTGAIYSQFCVPETKGLSADAIQLLFLKQRRPSIKNVK